MKRLVILLFCLVWTNLALAQDQFNFLNRSPQYIGVIDAGSSGSRLYLYQYRYPNYRWGALQMPSSFPQFSLVFSQKITPGLASFANDPETAENYLQPLLSQAQNQLNSLHVRFQQVPLYLFGTAGMRLLNADQQTNLYQAANEAMANAGFMTHTAQTISGSREGIYGWLSVNLLSGRLNSHALDDTIGVLDLGGASTQITFHTDETNANVTQFKLANQDFSVFTYSFLSLGNVQALAQLGSYGDSGACYPSDYNVTPENQFDANACDDLIDAEIAAKNVKQIVPAINPEMSFDAISGFYYVFDFFNANTLADLQQTTENICGQYNWPDLQALYPEVSGEYLQSYCFSGLYITQLLSQAQGYGFAATAQNITAINSINNQAISWTLGAALYQLVGHGLA